MTGQVEEQPAVRGEKRHVITSIGHDGMSIKATQDRIHDIVGIGVTGDSRS